MVVDTVTQALLDMWASLIAFIPDFLSATIVLVFGLVLASALGHAASRLARLLKLDDILARTGLTQRAASAGVHFTFSHVIGWLVKWFFIVVVLIAVADILRWAQITSFLNSVALYIPNVIIAVVILTIGLVVGQFAHNVVEQAIRISKTPTAAGKFLAALAKWATIIFAAMAAFIQLGIAARLIEILFTGLVAMVAIAGGVAFGWGGKDRAARWLEGIEREVSRRDQ